MTHHPTLAFSRELARILEKTKNRPHTYLELLKELGVRGQSAFLILLVAPMLQPIPLPGLSNILSIIAAFVGFQIIFGAKPWLPKKYAQKEVKAEVFEKLIHSANKALYFIQKVFRPKKRLYGHSLFIRKAIGVLIATSSLLLALPLPIPFSNFFPACTIFLLSLGLLEEDGVLALSGLLMFIASCVFFTTVVFVPWYYATK